MVNSKFKGGAGGGGADDDEPELSYDQVREEIARLEETSLNHKTELSDDQARAEVARLEASLANNKGIQRRHIPPKLNTITPTTINLIKDDISARTRFIRFTMGKILEVDNEISSWLMVDGAEAKKNVAELKEKKKQLRDVVTQKTEELNNILNGVNKKVKQMIIDEPKDNNKILLLLTDFLTYIKDTISHIKTILSEFFGKKKIDGGRTRRRNAISSKKRKNTRTKKYRR